MRLASNRGYGLGARLLFAVVRLGSGHPAPDAMKLVYFRPDFYGRLAKAATHDALRGPSGWTAAERELMAARVSRANRCAFCVAAHSAVAARLLGDRAGVDRALADDDAAPISPALRATLRLVDRLASTGEVDPEDVRAARAAGATPDQLEDALRVVFCFDVTNRLADALGFELPSPDAMEAGARFLAARGYR